METAIHIGAKVDKDAADGLAAAVVKIFESAANTRMDREVICCAIEAVTKRISPDVHSVAVTGNYITSQSPPAYPAPEEDDLEAEADNEGEVPIGTVNVSDEGDDEWGRLR